MIRVSELFVSLQGESTWAGERCAFVRLAGCTVGCTWCDTAYAACSNGTEMPIADIVEAVRAFAVPLVEITGGEPLEQQATPQLAAALLDAGFIVLLETSGTRDISLLPDGVHRIMDVKCPSSGVTEKMRWKNMQHLRTGDEVKFVIADETDFRFACDILQRYLLPAGCTALMSPVQPALAPATLAEWILRDHPPARLQLQMHKILWPDDPRGK